MNVVCHLDNQIIEENRSVMEDGFQEFIQVFIADSTQKLSALEQAIQESNIERITTLSHSLKGSCANFGAPYLSELFRNAEMKGREDSLQGLSEDLKAIRKEYHVVTTLVKTMQL